jgi:Putative phage tail protein
MIPVRTTTHPHIIDAMGPRYLGRRGHRRAGLMSSALTPYLPGLYRHKGGFMGIISSVVIGAVVGSITGGAGFALDLSAQSSFWGAVSSGAIMGAIGGVLTGVAALLMQPNTKQQSAAVTQNKVTIRDSIAPRKRIYGTVLAAGALIYSTSTGSNNSNIHMVTPLASHQVQAIREEFFNNLTATDSRFGSNYTINKYLGTQTQAADAGLVSASGGEWTTNHRGLGNAYIYSVLTYNQNSWVSGLPSVQAMVDGALVYDPRLSGTAISSSSAASSPGVFTTTASHGLSVGDVVFIRDHLGATYAKSNGLAAAVTKAYTVNTVPSATSFTLLNDSGNPMPLLSGGVGGTVTKCGWSNNWALAVLDYLLSQDGIDCPTSRIDWSYWTAAANTSDEDVSLGNSQTFTASPSSDQLTIANATGWTSGTQVFVSSSGTLPSPFVAGTPYFWIDSGGATPSIGQLAASYSDAVAALPVPIDITTAGAGTHTVAVSITATNSAASDTVTLSATSAYIETGDCVDLTGSLAGTDYYWFNTDYLTGKLATSRANALAGIAVNLTVDETVQITRKSQARYTVNGILDLSSKPIDILNQLLTAGGGVLVFTQGKYRLFAASAAASVQTISQDDLRGPIKGLPHTARQTLTNAVRGTYSEPAKYWQMTDFPALTNATYESEDGGQRLYQDISLPLTIDPQRAQRLASIVLGRARRGMVVTFPGRVNLLGLSPWDCVTLNLSVGTNSIISAKKFRVAYWTLAQDGQGIDVTLIEEDDAIYSWSYSQATVVPQNNLSNLPSPWTVAAPTGLAIQSGTSQLYVAGDGTVHTRAHLTWTAPADAFVTSGGWIEVQYKKHADSVWSVGTPVPGAQTFTYISDVADGVAYDFRVRSKNTLGAVSDADGATWSAAVSNYTVVGKSQPPSDVGSISVQQNGTTVYFNAAPISDLDVAVFEYRYGAPASWDQMHFIEAPAARPLQGVQLFAASFTTSSVPPGTWYFAVKAKDTSGNYSTNATYIQATINGQGSNVIATAPQASDWLGQGAGTSSGFIRHWTGVLIPDSTVLASAMSDADLWDTFNAFPVATSTYESVAAVDIGFTDNVRIYASPLTFSPGPGVTGSVNVDFQLDSWVNGGADPNSWQSWSAGSVSARYVRTRIVMTPGTSPGIVSAFTPTIDKQPSQQTWANLTVAAGGTAITFSPAYHSLPSVGVTPSGANVGWYSDLSTTGVTIHVGPDTGHDNGGTASVQVTGT